MRLICLTALVLAALVLAGRAQAAVAHTGRPGETLWSIAAANNLTTRALAAANGLSPEGRVVVGKTLEVPSESEAATALSAEGPVAETSGSGPCTWDCASTVHPHPTAEHTTSTEIGQVAAPHGVAGSLASGVGWQESRFDNSAVSSAGARGAMQIMPGTWIGSITTSPRRRSIRPRRTRTFTRESCTCAT